MASFQQTSFLSEKGNGEKKRVHVLWFETCVWDHSDFCTSRYIILIWGCSFCREIWRIFVIPATCLRCNCTSAKTTCREWRPLHPSVMHPASNMSCPAWPQVRSEEFTPAINDWLMGWGILKYIYIEVHTRICLLQNHSLWSGQTTEFYVHGITGWCWVESFQKQGPGDLGRVEILGMPGGNCMGKKTTKIYKLGNFCKHNIS